MIKINKLMNKRMSRKEFIKLAGIGMIGLMVFPNLINYFLNKKGLVFEDNKGLTIKGNKIYLNNKEIMEVSNG